MTARDFTPTDEQIAALADQIADYSGERRFPGAFDPYERAARTYVKWPAFQSIIAAAKAEARAEIADEILKRDWAHGERGDWAQGADSAAEEIVAFIREKDEASA